MQEWMPCEKKLGQLRDLEVIASMDATKMSGTGTERFDIPTVEKGFESLRGGDVLIDGNNLQILPRKMPFHQRWQLSLLCCHMY